MATKADSGRKGGLVTLERYGSDQLREWGNLGGRPRDKGYDEIRQQQCLERNNNKEATGPPSGNVRLLRVRLRQRQRSNGDENEQAGTAQETPREPALPERTQS